MEAADRQDQVGSAAVSPSHHRLQNCNHEPTRFSVGTTCPRISALASCTEVLRKPGVNIHDPPKIYVSLKVWTAQTPGGGHRGKEPSDLEPSDNRNTGGGGEDGSWGAAEVLEGWRRVSDLESKLHRRRTSTFESWRSFG